MAYSVVVKWLMALLIGIGEFLLYLSVAYQLSTPS